ncbi:hypothetical protein [Kitasatospora sp. NPDC059599]|uniref:hypothetical protein n=1 Tax=Kitasatospora sp. NPDC059599 TaxID=3346880 RepID=UPI003692E33E
MGSSAAGDRLRRGPFVSPVNAATVAGTEPRRSLSAGTCASQPSGHRPPPLPPAQRSEIRSGSMPCRKAQRQYACHTTDGTWQMPLWLIRIEARIAPSMVNAAGWVPTPIRNGPPAGHRPRTTPAASPPGSEFEHRGVGLGDAFPPRSEVDEYRDVAVSFDADGPAEAIAEDFVLQAAVVALTCEDRVVPGRGEPVVEEAPGVVDVPGVPVAGVTDPPARRCRVRRRCGGPVRLRRVVLSADEGGDVRRDRVGWPAFVDLADGAPGVLRVVKGLWGEPVGGMPALGCLPRLVRVATEPVPSAPACRCRRPCRGPGSGVTVAVGVGGRRLDVSGTALVTGFPGVSGRICAMTTDIRRAAGTRTLSDVLLSLVGVRRLSTEKDLADLRAGATLQVFCSSPTLGTVRMLSVGKGRTVAHAAAGHLYLAAGSVAWRHQRTREEVVLRGPFRLSPSEQRTPLPKMARFDLVVGEEQHVIVIPKADVALVTQVLEAAGR